MIYSFVFIDKYFLFDMFLKKCSDKKIFINLVRFLDGYCVIKNRYHVIYHLNGEKTRFNYEKLNVQKSVIDN